MAPRKPSDAPPTNSDPSPVSSPLPPTPSDPPVPLPDDPPMDPIKVVFPPDVSEPQTDADTTTGASAAGSDASEGDDAALDPASPYAVGEEERRCRQLIYQLERQATKGHGLDSDRALMQETATFLRSAGGMEGLQISPDGGLVDPDAPAVGSNPTIDPTGKSSPAGQNPA